MTRSVAAGCFSAALVLGTSAVAHATPTARLVYIRGEGAETCVDEAGLRTAVAGRLGYDPFRLAADNTVSVSVAHKNARFAARVSLADASNKERGLRELASKSDDCSDLTDALALTISIALDPLSLTRPSVPVPVPDPPIPDPPVPDPPPPVPDPPPPAPAPAPAPAPSPSPKSWDLLLGAGPHAAIGISPAIAPGAQLWIGLRTPRFELDAAGRFDVTTSDTTSQGGRVASSLVGGSIAPCARLAPLLLCLVGTAGAISAESRDVTTPRAATFPLLAVGARVAVDVPITTQLALRPALEGAFNLTPYELKVNQATVFTSAAGHGLASLNAVLSVF